MDKHDPTLLIVDADPQFGKMLRESLEQKKYRVDLETRGDRALQLFRAEKYDVVLVDVILPGLDGLELAKEIRKVDSLTPILFMSDKDNDKDKDNGPPPWANNDKDKDTENDDD